MASSLLLTMQGWLNNPGVAVSYNNDTGLWTSLANDPQVAVASDTGKVCRGGWDGNRWYTISPTGGLHAYTPTTNTWVAGLAGSGSIITGTPTSASWAMASDGSYIYILSSSNDFRRYDPSNDTLSSLAIPLGGGYGVNLFLTYDGSGSIYGSKGGVSSTSIGKYSIATNTWTALPVGPTLLDASWAAFLQGSLWLIVGDQGTNVLRSYQYETSSGSWTAKSTGSSNPPVPKWPGGEDSDSSIRIWDGTSRVYNINSNTWSNGAASPYSWDQGTNYAITRTFSAAFTWYQSDGTTLAPITIDLGTAVLGQTLTYHAKVKTPVGRAAGVLVSVPVNTSTDAEDPVLICETVGGIYDTSFSTGALLAGDEFDVFLQLTPTAQQTLGLLKRFSLEVSSN